MSTRSRSLWMGTALAALLAAAALAQSMSREPGTNRRGNDYSSFRVVTIDDCERACVNDRRCRAYTFSAKAGMCYLKDRVPSASTAPGQTSGVKGEFGDGPHYRPSPGGLTEERGIDYHGSDYASVRVRDLGDCQDRCRRDRRCASYSYDVRAAVCYLKDRVGDRRRDRDKIGGVKRGNVPAGPRPPYGNDLWEQRGYDYHGGDYTSSRVRDLGQCQELCWRDRRCAAYSYDLRTAICYLKDRVYDRRRDDTKVTGLKRR